MRVFAGMKVYVPGGVSCVKLVVSQKRLSGG